MRYAHLQNAIYCRPWLITPGAHHTIRTLFERHLDEGEGMDFSAFVNSRRELVIDDDGLATIHILGPLGKNLSSMEKQCGATSFEDIRSDYTKAIAGGANGILLHIDSPGGTVQGTPETAALIASQPLPTVAYTEDMMASAAYYLAAGATRIVSSPSAEVGSIGVYIPWVDSSAAIAAEGLSPDPIVNQGGDLKALGFGGTLTDEQRAYLQAEVDADFAEFKGHILNHRTVPDHAMRGQTLSGKTALQANLVDTIGDITTARSILRALIK